MIQRKYRPQQWRDMVGQTLSVRILQMMVERPERIPPAIIFEGAFGSGKTTAARLFARALHCRSLQPHAEPCGVCRSCTTEVESLPTYYEYDVSSVGNVEQATTIKEQFATGDNGKRQLRVVTLDEAHLASTEAQSVFLKLFEDAPPGMVFLLCTTDGDKLLGTIRSRSLELQFSTIPAPLIIANLEKILAAEGGEASERTLSLIAERSRGHLRDAHKLLDLLLSLGEERFVKVVRSSLTLFLHYFKAIADQDKDRVQKVLERLACFPLSDLRQDFQAALLELIRASVGLPVSEQAEEVVKLLGPRAVGLVKLGLQEWVSEGFRTDLGAQAALLTLFALAGGATGQSAGSARPTLQQLAQKRG